MSAPIVKYSAPIVKFDGLTYDISLFRADATGFMKKVKHSFGEHILTVCGCKPEELHMWDRAKINGPPAEDGLLYYLFASNADIGRPSLIWLKDKEEAIALRKALRVAEETAYEASFGKKDRKCTFCDSMESDCCGDHGDEMRDGERHVRGRAVMD
ncbi:MAG: hypothetical protein EBY32_18560 [Proteobacteria bacterium]|nr:hypothetical protein [Pseudomonadota bacterium]